MSDVLEATSVGIDHERSVLLTHGREHVLPGSLALARDLFGVISLLVEHAQSRRDDFLEPCKTLTQSHRGRSPMVWKCVLILPQLRTLQSAWAEYDSPSSRSSDLGTARMTSLIPEGTPGRRRRSITSSLVLRRPAMAPRRMITCRPVVLEGRTLTPQVGPCSSLRIAGGSASGPGVGFVNLKDGRRFA